MPIGIDHLPAYLDVKIEEKESWNKERSLENNKILFSSLAAKA